MIERLNAIIKYERLKKFESNNQLSLGDLIIKIDEMLKKGRKREPYILFGGTRAGSWPVDIDSWRGSYNELSLDPSKEDKGKIKATKFIKMLKDANGDTFTGYKGGEYKMNLGTPIWADNYGCYQGHMVTKIYERNGDIYLRTKIDTEY